MTSALVLLLLAGCGTSSAIEESRDYARLADYQHAFEVLVAARERQLERSGEVDEELAREYEIMRLKFLRDRAMRRIFGEQEELALRDLDRIAETDPNYPRTAELRAMALRKKALRIVRKADESLKEGELFAAMEGYLKSQALVKDFEPAQDGIDKVGERIAKLDARARQQFLQAVRKVPEFRYAEVAWHAASVLANTPDPNDEKREQASRLQAQARAKSAREVAERAEQCEHQNRFGAALVLYREVERLDPDNAGVQESIQRMKDELAAMGMLERAQLELENGNFDTAEELLDEAFAMSKLSRGVISEVMIRMRKERAADEYQKALDLQILGKKAEALAAFEALIEAHPEGVEDEKLRAESLRVDIAGAKEEWQAAVDAEKAGKLEEALDHYINAERFYEAWREGEKEIERLRGLIAERAEAGGGEGEGSGGGS